MDKTKQEDLEKAYRKEDSGVVPGILAVPMACARKMSIG